MVGRPKIGSIGVMVKVPPPLLAAIDRWIAEDGAMLGAPAMTRPEALRRLATEQLVGLGILPPER